MRTALVGQQFGRLTVLQYAYSKNGSNYWHCGCTCGNLKPIYDKSLRRGETKSCGCLRLEYIAKWARSITTHGQARLGKKTKAYTRWLGIRQRCHNPAYHDYPNYGGRGIQVCKRWRESFDNFYADMGDPPPGMTIDRIDNNKGYSPGNCRWATSTEQNRNKSNNVLITYKNKTQPLSAWAEELGLSEKCLGYRLREGGWTLERAMTKPLREKITYQGTTQSITAWERTFGFPKGRLFQRLRRGWSIEKAFTTPLQYLKLRKYD